MNIKPQNCLSRKSCLVYPLVVIADGILKSEMFYGYEKTFKSIEHLEQAIVDYINYYNNKRIKIKLKGFSPVQYRTKSFA